MKGNDKTVLFSDDANLVLYYPEYPANREQISKYIGMLAEKVDIVAWDCLVNGVCWYDSVNGPNIWEGRDEFPVSPLKHLADNIKALSAAGSNPPAAVSEECHKHGILMLAGIRMGLSMHDESSLRNEGGVYRNCRMTDEFYNRINRNTDLSLEAEISRTSKIAANLDFTYPEVRELILSPCREMASSFPIDGFELNFIRGGIPFESHEAEAKAPIMTGFIADIRKILDESAVRQGKDRTLLAVRIPCDLDFCRRIGLDAEAWVRQGLIDIIAPDVIHRMIFDAHIDRFKEICKGHDIKVLPCLHPCPSIHEPRAVYRAGLDNAYRQGADGFSTFNLSGHFFHPYDGFALDWFDGFRRPETVACDERIFPVMRYTVPQDDLYNMQQASVTFRKHETGIRKTVVFPRIIALQDGDPEAVLKFKIKGWSRDDAVDVDLDGIKLAGLKCRLSIDPFFSAVMDAQKGVSPVIDPYEADRYEWDTYDFETPLKVSGHMPGSFREIGFTVVKRTNVVCDLAVKDISVHVSD
jgi:hypothetical protein